MQLVAVTASQTSRSLLTKELLQLHDAGVGPDAMHRLCLLSIRSILENLAVRSVWIMLVRHDSVELFVEIGYVDRELVGFRELSSYGLGTWEVCPELRSSVNRLFNPVEQLRWCEAR